MGKRKSSLTLEEEVQRVREEGFTESVKNHMMRLSVLWNQLHQRELVTRNPWTGWNFDKGQKTIRRSWTARELALLALKDTTKGCHLIPGLETSKQGVRGVALGRAFSLLKPRIGLPPETQASLMTAFASNTTLGAPAPMSDLGW